MVPLSEPPHLVPASLVCFFSPNLSLCSNEQSILTTRDIILIAAFYPRLKHTETPIYIIFNVI